MANDFYPDGISKLVKVLILSDHLLAYISHISNFKSQISNRVFRPINNIIFSLSWHLVLRKRHVPPPPPLFYAKKSFRLLNNPQGQLRIPPGRFSPNSPSGFSDPIPAFRAEKKYDIVQEIGPCRFNV